ncbi:MAG: hypothetical protein HDS75_08735 [Bacteroidales bacterium]|nr:hypothetical protein [Bacteroidales bacterium]
MTYILSHLRPRHVIKALLGVLLTASAVSCRNDNTELTFVGDSIVARWDLDEFFPHYPHVNLGQSGSGISYLQRTISGKDFDYLVILSGTNDNYSFTEGNIDAYVKRYVEIIESAHAGHIYLYSVLPRDFASDDASVNTRITAFNRLVSNTVAGNQTITYINAFDYFYTDGHIDKALYSDRLHLSRDGYEVLSSLLKGILDK